MAKNKYELLEFTIPDWALSSLINGDDSGLEDEDIEKLDKFVKKTVAEYGNANFILPRDKDIELGFQRRNDIDNLGNDCSLLYLRPSKKYDEGGKTDDDDAKFESDYLAMKNHIKKGIGTIDEDYIEETWSNISDINYSDIEDKLIKRLKADNLIEDSEIEEDENEQRLQELADEYDIPTEVIEEYASDMGIEISEITDLPYNGRYNSEEDYAEEMVNDGVITDLAFYLEMSSTDMRILAQEEADRRVDDMDDDDLLSEADMEDEANEYDETKDEIDVLEDEISDLKSEIDDLFEDEDEDTTEGELEQKEERAKELRYELNDKENELDRLQDRLASLDSYDEVVDKAREELREQYYDDVYDALDKDAVGYFVDELGYNMSDLATNNLFSVDYEKLARDLSHDVNFIYHNGDVYVFSNYERGGMTYAKGGKLLQFKVGDYISWESKYDKDDFGEPAYETGEIVSIDGNKVSYIEYFLGNQYISNFKIGDKFHKSIINVESSSEYAEGGGIPNNYRGKTTDDIWNMLTENQRLHFLFDHAEDLKVKTNQIPTIAQKNWNDLSEDVKEQFKFHTMMGQYAKGGGIPKSYTHFIVRKSDNKIINGYDYKGVDADDIKYYTKEDFKDMEISSKDFTLLTKKSLESKGINPYDESNWTNSYADGGMMAKGGKLKVGDTIYRAWFTNDDGEKNSVIIVAKNETEAEKIAKKIDSDQFSYVSNPIKIKNEEILFEESRENEPIYKMAGGGVTYGRFSGRMGKYAQAIASYIDRSPNGITFEELGRYLKKEFPSKTFTKQTLYAISRTLYKTKDYLIDDDKDWKQSVIKNKTKMSYGSGGVTFDEKVSSISKALLKRKKVSPSVQKDYGKTYSKKEAIESAKRIAGAMRKKEKMSKGGKVNLNKDYLSSSEYQIAKKKKDFNKDEWEWNSSKDLYVKIKKKS